MNYANFLADYVNLSISQWQIRTLTDLSDMLKGRAGTRQELYLSLGWLSEELRKGSVEEQSSILILDSVKLN